MGNGARLGPALMRLREINGADSQKGGCEMGRAIVIDKRLIGE